MSESNRYSDDWNAYSKSWDATYGKQFAHIGDEWNAGQRQTDEFVFHEFAEPFLNKDMTVLEVGPGGGKWSVQIAPRVKKLIVLDVAEEMLKRTRTRCDSLGLKNVEYVHGNGRDFRPVADASVNFFFSYDVFVHIALEDTFSYVYEMSRVLAPGSIGVCHHAINTVPGAYFRLETEVDHYRGGKNTLGQYYYHSPEGLRRMYEHCGLPVIRTDQWWCLQILAFRKAEGDIIPRMELLLRRLMSDETDHADARKAVVDELRGLPARLEKYLAPLMDGVASETDRQKRMATAAAIRRAWRGLL